MARRSALKVIRPSEPIKLDLGCGKNKKEGFTGVDRRRFEGVDVVHDFLKFPWPWKDESVEEVHMSHCLEHFHGPDRVKIFNELYRIMQKGAKATIITPHWSSGRAYGDFTHVWPPVSGFMYFYLSKKWRDENAPDTDIEWNPAGYSCDFEATWGFTMHPDVANKNQERQIFAMTFYIEATQDIVATLTKK